MSSSDSSPPPAHFEQEELAIHRLFGLLRREVSKVSSSFRTRVARAVDNAGDTRAEPPRTGALITSVLVESLNLLAAAFRNPGPPEDKS